ncbi:hypothetical protein J437_LFUL016134 [Ladona fulva]|uniref:Uncharacterized protein n=1 Tax=Ladona fulva TaxID=123851 RepID=A0A8K0P6N7_LADFU|nr:hypothetical protein J437_LFUL016134 [Ladona fulva]
MIPKRHYWKWDTSNNCRFKRVLQEPKPVKEYFPKGKAKEKGEKKNVSLFFCTFRESRIKWVIFLRRNARGGVSKVLELSETEIENILRAFSSDEELGEEDYESEGEEEGSQASEGGPVSSTLVTAEVPFSPLAVSNPLDTAIPHSSSAALEHRPIVKNAAPPSIPRIPFVGIPGLRKITISQTPRGYFDLLFSDELYELVLGETEKFAEQLYLDSPYD